MTDQPRCDAVDPWLHRQRQGSLRADATGSSGSLAVATRRAGELVPRSSPMRVRRPWELQESACPSATWTWQRPALPLVTCAVALNLTEPPRPTELSTAAA